MNGSPVTGGTGRDLLSLMAAVVVVATSAIAVMAVVAGAAVDGAGLVAIAAALAAVTVPGMSWRRRARDRRLLQRRVGDPAGLTGVWRRLLARAWTARDQFVEAVGGFGPSPLQERLADHRAVVDAALERCGALARDGDLMARQLRGYRARRLRLDLRTEQWRDADGPRAQRLTQQVRDVDQWGAHLRQVHDRLEAQVHDLQTAAWRATALRTTRSGARDAALEDLLEDLRHLREALESLDDVPQPTTAGDGRPNRSRRSASTAGGGYDV